MEETNNPVVDSQEEQPQTGTGQPTETSAQTDSEKANQPEQPVTEEDVLAVLEKAELPESAKEELKRGYLRQQDYTKKTQELSSLKKELAQGRPTKQTVLEDDSETVETYVDRRTTPIEERIALVEFKASHPDAGAVEPKMVEIIQQHPELADFRMLEVVYKLAKADMSASELAKAKQSAAKRTEGIKAVVDSENPSQPRVAPKRLTEEDLRAMPLKDLEQLLGI